MNEDALAVLLEGFNPAHIHCVLVVAEIESAAVCIDGRVGRTLLVGSGGTFASRFAGQRAVHPFNDKINKPIKMNKNYQDNSMVRLSLKLKQIICLWYCWLN